MEEWYVNGDQAGEIMVSKDPLYFDRLPSPDCYYWCWPNNDVGIGEIVNPIMSLEPSLSWSTHPVHHPLDHIFLSPNLLNQDVHTKANTNCDPAVDEVESPKCFKTPKLSPSIGSYDGQSIIIPNSSNCGNISDQSQDQDQSIKASETMMQMLLSSNQQTSGEESSIEESALLQLEAVLKQLGIQTRLSFRDSLYRLAQRYSHPQMSTEVSEEGLLSSRRSQRKHPRSSSETNTIDRAVASLLFHTINADHR